MPTISATSAPSTDLHYEERGTGKPVVLIHGWPLSGAMWESQVNALSEAGYRCITYDRRGFGQSGRPAGGYDYDTFAADLDDLLTALDLREVTLAGFSMGGGEVARYVGRYGAARIAKTMLLGSITPFMLQTADNADGVPGEVFDGMIAGVTKDRVGFLADFFPNFYGLAPDTTVPAERDLLAFSKSVAWPASALGTRECITAFGTTDFRADLAKFTMPTLVAHGDRDQIVPFEKSGRRTAELIRGSRLEVIAGAPHGMAATHAAELDAVMLDFLKS